MLQRRLLTPSTRPWSSSRLASQLTQNPVEDRPVESTATSQVSNAERARKPSSILSRLSDRTRSRVRRPDAGQQNPDAQVEVVPTPHRTPRPRATSFVSALSAQKRDHAAEKWFVGVRELDISNVNQLKDLKPQLRKNRRSEYPTKHEIRPKTDLNALFTPSAAHSATSLRLQTRKELGGDYTSYLPDGYADPLRLPVAYARLVLGRNKHIPLNAQTGALHIVEEVIQGKTTRQGRSAFDAH